MTLTALAQTPYYQRSAIGHGVLLFAGGGVKWFGSASILLNQSKIGDARCL